MCRACRGLHTGGRRRESAPNTAARYESSPARIAPALPARPAHLARIKHLRRAPRRAGRAVSAPPCTRARFPPLCLLQKERWGRSWSQQPSPGERLRWVVRPLYAFLVALNGAAGIGVLCESGQEPPAPRSCGSFRFGLPMGGPIREPQGSPVLSRYANLFGPLTPIGVAVRGSSTEPRESTHGKHRDTSALSARFDI